MFLNVQLDIKFRAFGITLGTLSKSYHIHLTAPGEVPRTLVDLSERGARLYVALALGG